MDRNIRSLSRGDALCLVALRKESVDRNVDPDADTLTDDVSLSARRAWIEMSQSRSQSTFQPRRSPQGERG